ICGPALRLPPIFHFPAEQCSSYEARLRHLLSKFMLWASEQTNVKVVNHQFVDRAVAAAARFDLKADLLTGVPHTPGYSDCLADVVGGLLAPTAPKKGLITDLDGTLWKGIVGEVGAGAVCWDLTGHGQAHGLYQQLLQALAGEGVLIGAATKNDPQGV